MRALLAVVCLSACAARQVATLAVQQAVTSTDGDSGQYRSCSSEANCPSGGGTGSFVLPLAVIGATALVIAGVTYGYSLVQEPAHITRGARHSTP